MTTAPQEAMGRWTRRLRVVGYAAVIACWLAVAGVVLAGGDKYQWDFRTYYLAGRAWSLGLNPYDVEALAALCGHVAIHPFIYPPIVLPALAVVAQLPYHVAAAGWLLAQLAGLALLFALWRRRILPQVDGLLLATVMLLAFSAAFALDLKAGNVSVFEHVLLWCAFAAYLRGSLAWFAVPVVVAAAPKLMPVAFLGLLFVGPGNRVHRLAVGMAGVLAVGAMVLAPLASHPDMVKQFLQHGPAKRNVGPSNPSAPGFIHHLSTTRELGPVFQRVPHLQSILWAAYLLLILGFSAGPLRRVLREDDRRAVVMVAVMLYVLVAPRMMWYSYGLMVPPALWLLDRCKERVSLLLFAAVILCLPVLSPFDVISKELRHYYPWVLTLGLWALWVSGAAQGAQEPDGGPGSPLAGIHGGAGKEDCT